MDSLDLCLICGSHVPNSDVAYCSQNCRDIDLSPQNNTLTAMHPLAYPVHVSSSSSSSSPRSYHPAMHRSPSSTSTFTGRDRHGIAVWASRVSGGGSYGDHQQPDMSSTFEDDDEDEDEVEASEEVMEIQHLEAFTRHPMYIPHSSVSATAPLPRYKFPLTPSQPAPAAISLLPNTNVHQYQQQQQQQQPRPQPQHLHQKKIIVSKHQSSLSTSSSDATSLETPFTPASSASSHQHRLKTSSAKWPVEDPFISSPPYDYTLRSKHAQQASPRQFVDRGRSLYRADGW